jgi:pyruvate-ferredoxin/flavodoxin oxidoreductase
VACHQFTFLERYDMLSNAKQGATFLLNSPYGPDNTWDKLPNAMQQQIIDKEIKFYVLDGYEVAKETGMGRRINTIMQTGFFALSGVLPQDEAIAAIKYAIKKTYSKRGDAVVEANYKAVDGALAHMHRVTVPTTATSTFERPPAIPDYAPEFIKSVTARIIEGIGDSLPVSAMPIDGTYPTNTTMWEKRNISIEIPVWDPDICIQCGKCAMVCPHGVIRMKVYDPAKLEGAPETFKSAPARLYALCGSVPSQEQNATKIQSHQYGRPTAVARVGKSKLGILWHTAIRRSYQHSGQPGQIFPTA